MTIDADIVAAGTHPERARGISERFGIPLAATTGDPRPRWRLVDTGDRIELHDTSNPKRGPVWVDFAGADTRTGAGNLSRKQPLPRAIGAKSETVLDATAGFGGDAALLAMMGFEVLAVERAPVVAVLLEDGLARSLLDPEARGALGDRLRVQWSQAADVLEQQGPFDTVYLDPMFPPRRKRSALPKKNLQFLRELLGPDPDVADLLARARERCHRVVVKRPADAGPIAADVSLAQAGKLVRYDVYIG